MMMMMKMKKRGREGKAGSVSGDMLVCFPSRPHWGLMPKPICSPGRASQSGNRQSRRRHVSKSSTLLWAKAESAAPAEPSSPKVTCAGRIKVTQSNWQCMMDEVENIHHDAKVKKKSGWAESVGFRKREIMQFLTCLRTLRFDLRCFGSFPAADNTTEDDDDEEEEEEEGYRENHVVIEETRDEDSRDVFSKWFMRLEENQDDVFDTRNEDNIRDDVCIDEESCVPPPNALLLMRCSSAPAKSWCQVKQEQEKEDQACTEEGGDNVDQTNAQSMKMLMEKEDMVLMTYGSDFHKMSSDIAKETWIVSPLRDPLSKSRSWRI